MSLAHDAYVKKLGCIVIGKIFIENTTVSVIHLMR